MARIFSKEGADDAPAIDREQVAKFFAERAEKYATLGAVRTVIYQDKAGDLAERRDAAEKAKLMPLLSVTKQDRVLDVGCGPGRWTDTIAAVACAYHGFDFSPELIAIARTNCGALPNVKLTVAPVDGVSLERLDETEGFDKVLCAGVFIYLNDSAMLRALASIADCAATACRIVLREPVATVERLTIKEHFSEDMDQYYNAIYRTEAEMTRAFERELFTRGFRLRDCGDVYESALNNRADTKQRWYVLERDA